MAAKKGGARPGAGRPRTVFDWDQVGRLCKIQCTQDEIIDILGTTIDTLADACKRELGVDFSTFYSQKRAGGKRSLRRKQWQTAVEDGNPTLLIWLGKQYLGQSEKQELTGKDGKALFEKVEIILVEPGSEQAEACSES